MPDCSSFGTASPPLHAGDGRFDGIVEAEAFYLSGDGDLSAITRNLTLQYPSRRDTITFFSAESNFRVTKMRSILRIDDAAMYPGIRFSLRHSQTFPSRGLGVEFVTGGMNIDFYPNENSLITTTFNSDTIQQNDYVWLETLDLKEGSGMETELAISLFLER